MKKILKKICGLALILVLLSALLAACSIVKKGTSDPLETAAPSEAIAGDLESTAPENPTEVAPEEAEETTAPMEEETVPPTTEVPEAEAPATEPPATEPAATEPPKAQSPTTKPPATQKPTTPPPTEPPATETPVTQPPATEPPATEAPSIVPPVTEPPVTEPPAIEPPATDPPATEPTEPTGCNHEWKRKYHPEEGHYSDPYVRCDCGAKFATVEAWIAHSKSFSQYDAFTYHGGWRSGKEWIIDSPEYYEWICQKCGYATLIEP